MINCKVAGDCLPGGNFFRHDRPEGYPGAVAHAHAVGHNRPDADPDVISHPAVPAAAAAFRQQAIPTDMGAVPDVTLGIHFCIFSNPGLFPGKNPGTDGYLFKNFHMVFDDDPGSILHRDILTLCIPLRNCSVWRILRMRCR